MAALTPFSLDDARTLFAGYNLFGADPHADPAVVTQVEPVFAGTHGLSSCRCHVLGEHHSSASTRSRTARVPSRRRRASRSSRLAAFATRLLCDGATARSWEPPHRPESRSSSSRGAMGGCAASRA